MIVLPKCAFIWANTFGVIWRHYIMNWWLVLPPRRMGHRQYLNLKWIWMDCIMRYGFLFSTWCEMTLIQPRCISICIGFSLYGIHMPLFSLYDIHIPLFPYMVIQPIVLGMALLWAAMDSSLSQGPLLWHHYDMTVIVSWNMLGCERDTRQCLDNMNARRLYY